MWKQIYHKSVILRLSLEWCALSENPDKLIWNQKTGWHCILTKLLIYLALIIVLSLYVFPMQWTLTGECAFTLNDKISRAFLSSFHLNRYFWAWLIGVLKGRRLSAQLVGSSWHLHTTDSVSVITSIWLASMSNTDGAKCNKNNSILLDNIQECWVCIS